MSLPAAPEARWLPSRVVVEVLAAGLVVLAVGAVVGRPDVAVLAVAPLLTAERLLRSRPSGVALASSAAEAGEAGTLTTTAQVQVPPATVALVVRAQLPTGRPAEAVVAVRGGRRTLRATTASLRTGPVPAPDLEHVAVGPGAGSRSAVTTERPRTLRIAPRARPLPAAPVPSRLRGVAGSHESRRPGEGGSLRDVHPFGPGDRMSRIDWRTTARRSPQLEQLYVRRTLGLAEATVTLVVDSRDEVGPDPTTWGLGGGLPGSERTSLDLAREAAASLAQLYLSQGDRLALEDLGRRRHPGRPGSGRRHVARVLDALAQMAPEGEPLRRVRAPRIAAGSLVYVLSTFLDPEAALVAEQWAASGHRVVAVDVLPRLVPRRLDGRQRLAMRVVTMRREDRLAALAAAGVPTVRWSEDPARDLLALARLERRR
ncbi:uncharacterized protein (DUF58 family) [Motilibacter peucedani]|uniref:Uncharacterized protein (DUF58 family) n=1 Tax=Motilibacter peucedani TaxID=598650 RepID=A0A420XQL8_9ACTN|nr:DUF58 domain-containing protein [Motilibacter peucedani]RKS75502.1 uncharacterized protein (DUF58 family) [Motilibacter peucedani]